MLLYVFPNKKKKKNPCYDMMICLGGFYTKDHLTRLSKIDHLTS